MRDLELVIAKTPHTQPIAKRTTTVTKNQYHRTFTPTAAVATVKRPSKPTAPCLIQQMIFTEFSH